MNHITVSTRDEATLEEFLQDAGFDVQQIDPNLWHVAREDELPVFMSSAGSRLYFEVDLGAIGDLKENAALLYRLLDLNTEILPVSAGVNSADPNDAHLVLVESRETVNLNDNELLAVFDALELAADRVESILESELQPAG